MTTSNDDQTSKLLDDLGCALNEIHQVSYSKNFWERFLGYWLLNFVDLVKVEWEATNNRSPRQSELLSTASYSRLGETRATHRMSQLLAASQREQWRVFLRNDVESFIFAQKFVGGRSHERNMVTREDSTLSNQRLKRIGLRMLMRSPVQTHRYFLATTYLSLRSRIALASKLRSLMGSWVEPALPESRISHELRSQVSICSDSPHQNHFEQFVRMVLPQYLPTSVIENFEIIKAVVDEMRLRRPKVIFSANLHFASDTFAYWLAKQCEMGAVLLLSQHGGLNGQGLHPTNDEILEKRIADRYCHWGWSTGPTDVRIPAQPIVWVQSRRRLKSNGSIVLMSDATFRFKRNTWTDSHRYKQLVTETFGALPDRFRSRAIVRLHRDHDRYDESHVGLWNGSFPEAILDDGWRSVKKLQKSAMLLICTTFGTTEIECFGRNIPVVLSLDPVLHQPRESFSDLLFEMESVGLVHFNRESLRTFLDKNLDDLGSWWNSEVVQQTVFKYMNKYGYMPRRPISELARILREAESSSRKRSLPQSN